MNNTYFKKPPKLRKNPLSFILWCLVHFSALLVVFVVLFIIIYLLVKGIPNLSPKIFQLKYNSDNVSLMPALINTVFMILLSMAFAIPVGIGSGIYLTEYAKKGNKVVTLIRVTSETLGGIPSIVYGLFGALLFVKYLHLGLSMLSGALTLAIMILPVIMRTTEEAIMTVPKEYKEGSFGLGAGKLYTIFKVILPSAMSGILSGIVLGVGRIIGESAAIIFTAGTVAKIATSAFDSSRTLAVHMYVISTEGIHMKETFATAVILIILVLIVNTLSNLLCNAVGSKK